MDAKWVGLQNYIDVIQNPEMKKLLINTLRISVARLIFTFIPPIILTLVIFDLKRPVQENQSDHRLTCHTSSLGSSSTAL